MCCSDAEDFLAWMRKAGEVIAAENFVHLANKCAIKNDLLDLKK